MAEKDLYAGNYHILYDNNGRGPVLRRGYQVWQHETENFVIYVGRSLKWNIGKKTNFFTDTDRTRETDFKKQKFKC